ncbi:MAG TPA: protoporphyrinogen oxidase [Chloroflexota bacterium]|nr:protoporphyrinogen oxidase [Chloroflexota bacterium]
MTSTTDARRIVIIGAGISGLAAGYRLARRAPQHSILLIDSHAEVGGKIRTRHLNGYTIEDGPDSFLGTKPQAVELAHELGVPLQGVNLDTRRTYVLGDGELHDLPEGLSGLVPAKLGPLLRSALLSPAGKARVAAEWFVPRGSNEETTLGAFMRRRMGREVYEKLVEPLTAGIYGGNGDEISLSATFPQLLQLEQEHGSLLRGLRQRPRPRTATSPFLTPVAGTAALAGAVAGSLPRPPSLTTCATAISRRGGGWIVHTDRGEILADGVILAVPAPVAGQLLAPVDADLAAELLAVRYAPAATASLGFRLDKLPPLGPFHGYLVPRRERSPVMAVTWSSEKFDHRAPPGQTLLRVFFGRADQSIAAMEWEGLEELARSELRERLGIAATPDIVATHVWNDALPQYALGHAARVARIRARVENLPRLSLAGAAYRGVGIPDCIQSGYDAADHVT